MQIGRATDRSGRRGRRGRRGGGDPRRRLRRSQDRRSAGWPTSRRKPTGSSRRGSRDVVGRRERPPPPRWDLPRPRPGGVRQRLDVRLRRRHWPGPTPTSRLSRGARIIRAGRPATGLPSTRSSPSSITPPRDPPCSVGDALHSWCVTPTITAFVACGWGR